MEGVPNLTLTSGGIGTVYGGGNEGDMLAQEETRLNIPTTYGNSENVDVKEPFRIFIGNEVEYSSD